MTNLPLHEAGRTGSWLCPTAGDRQRLADMEQRLRPVRTWTLGALAVALLLCGPWLGYWTLLPLGLAALGFAVVDRHGDQERLLAPEYRVAAAWLVAELAIAGAVAASGGPHTPTVSWLVIPVVTLPARFGARGVGAGMVVAAALMVGVTVGVDAGAVHDAPQLLVTPLALLFAVATLSTALMHSDLHHRSVAVIDPLTGMLNRAALASRTAELTQQAAVIGRPIALVAGDLDHFKAVNDEHGHATGDAVLKDVAYCLRKELRAFDLVYRLGGEEFLVVVPGADLPQAAAIAEDLRAAIANAVPGGLQVTMSFGVAVSPPGAYDFEATFARADRALYRAKQRGRDQVATEHDHIAVAPGLHA